MKRILCIGRVRNGGPVEIDTGQTLEERLDAAIASTAEILAMNRDFEAMRTGRTTPGITWSDEDEEVCRNENIGQDIGQSPWKW